MTDSTDPPALWSRDEIESPCVRICMLHPDTGLCVGCRRTGDEIAGWSGMSPDQRRRIIAELPSREAGPGRRGGARAARRGSVPQA